MKTRILVLMLVQLAFTTMNAQSFEWAKSIGGLNYDESRAIGVDNAGNVYTSGTLQQYVGTSVDFDPGVAEFYLEITNQFVGYISKLDAQGNFVWAKLIGPNVYANAMTVGVDNSIYIAGSYSGIVDFNPGTGVFEMEAPVNFTESPFNGFVLKINADGEFIWANNIGSTYLDEAIGISVNANGVLVGGYYTATVNFGTAQNPVELTATNFKDGYVVKYDLDGNTIWAKGFGGTGPDFVWDVYLDADGNSFATGEANQNADLDPNEGVSTLPEAGAFFLKLDNLGNFVFAKGIPSSVGYAIRTDNNGDVYCAGTFQGAVDFNPGDGTYIIDLPGSAQNVFLSKFNALGEFIWTRGIYSYYAETTCGIEIKSNGNIVLGGTKNYSGLNIFEGPMDFAVDFAGYALMMLEFNPSGDLQATNFIGGSDVRCAGFTIDDTGFIYATGDFTYTSDFNPDAGVLNLVSLGYLDNYICKFKLNPFTEVGITELIGSDFKVYPNPNSGNFTIHLENNLNTPLFSLYDVSGKLLQSEVLKNQSNQMNLNGISSGIYFGTLSNESELKTFKIVVN
jgi:hypothetical protein